jgi:hypothetical protein
MKPSTRQPMISGASQKNKDPSLPMDLSHRNRRLCGLEAQSRAFNSGAGVETFTTCRSLSAPELRKEGGEPSRAFPCPPCGIKKGRRGFREVFPAFQDPAPKRDPRLPSRIPEGGQARAGLFPISFLKRNGEHSVNGTGSAAQKVTDGSVLHRRVTLR